MLSSFTAVSASLCLWLDFTTAKSDCECIKGFDRKVMPKNFSAVAYSNGTRQSQNPILHLRFEESLMSFSYSFGLDFPPAATHAS